MNWDSFPYRHTRKLLRTLDPKHETGLAFGFSYRKLTYFMIKILTLRCKLTFIHEWHHAGILHFGKTLAWLIESPTREFCMKSPWQISTPEHSPYISLRFNSLMRNIVSVMPARHSLWLPCPNPRHGTAWLTSLCRATHPMKQESKWWLLNKEDFTGKIPLDTLKIKKGLESLHAPQRS